MKTTTKGEEVALELYEGVKNIRVDDPETGKRTKIGDLIDTYNLETADLFKVEIIRKLVNAEARDRYKQEVANMLALRAWEYRYKGTFGQGMHSGLKKLYKNKNFSLNHYNHMMMLSPYQDPEQMGLLANPNTGEPLKLKDIGKIWDMTSKTSQIEAMKELISHEIIIPVDYPNDKRQKMYYFNHEIMNANAAKVKKNQNATKVYSKKLMETKRAIRVMNEQAGLKKGEAWNPLGLLGVIMEFVHKELLYVCENPNDTVLVNPDLGLMENLNRYEHEMLSKVKYMDLKKLAKLAKVTNEEIVLKYLKVLHNVGAIFMVEKDNGLEGKAKFTKRRILIHPDLMFRNGTGMDGKYYSITIRSLFTAFEMQGGEDEI